MDTRSLRYLMDDGRIVLVTIDAEMWHVILGDDPGIEIIGAPLETSLMELVGMSPVHEDMPESIRRLGAKIRKDFPREIWPAEETDSMRKAVGVQ